MFVAFYLETTQKRRARRGFGIKRSRSGGGCASLFMPFVRLHKNNFNKRSKMFHVHVVSERERKKGMKSDRVSSFGAGLHSYFVPFSVAIQILFLSFAEDENEKKTEKKQSKQPTKLITE